MCRDHELGVLLPHKEQSVLERRQQHIRQQVEQDAADKQERAAAVERSDVREDHGEPAERGGGDCGDASVPGARPGALQHDRLGPVDGRPLQLGHHPARAQEVRRRDDQPGQGAHRQRPLRDHPRRTQVPHELREVSQEGGQELPQGRHLLWPQGHPG